MATTSNYKDRFKAPERTVADLNKLCGASFEKLKIPVHWKFKEYQQVRLTEDEDSEIQAIAAIFIDKQTSGMNLKHYRVNFHTHGERLSICEVSFVDYGKQAFKCLENNRKPEQMNEFLAGMN